MSEPEQPEGSQAVIDLPRDRDTGLRVGRIVLFGPTGSGKTLTACALADSMAPPAYEEIYVLSPVATAANHLPRAKWFQISPTNKAQVEKFMATMKEQRGLLIVDEADSYFGGSSRTFGTDSMFEAVNFGRNAGLSMIVIAHGTNVAPKNLIANAQAVFFYRTTEPNLIDYAEDYIADDIPDVAHVLRNLPDYVALVYAPMSREKFVGFAKLDIITGQIEIWKPESETTDTNEEAAETEAVDPSTPTTESSTPSSPGASAHSPAAHGPSKTGTGVGTVPNTAPPAGGSTAGFGWQSSGRAGS